MRKVITKAAIAISIIALLSACGTNTNTKSNTTTGSKTSTKTETTTQTQLTKTETITQTKAFQSISTQEFAEVIKDTSIILVDVRTPEEHMNGAIPGTDYNINFLDKNFSEETTSLLPKGATVAIYCRSGNRSKKAAKTMTELGYTVIELADGWNSWKNQH